MARNVLQPGIQFLWDLADLADKVCEQDKAKQGSGRQDRVKADLWQRLGVSAFCTLQA